MFKKGNNLNHYKQIGIWQTPQQFQWLWFDENQQPQSFCLDLTSPNPIQSFLKQFKAQFNHQAMQLHFIASMTPHLIWSKTLILTQSLSPQECEQQCRFTLEKELPIPLDELFSEYHSVHLNQGFRLDIFAVKKAQIYQFQQQYAPFQLKVIDSLQYSLVRAFEYLIGKQPPNTLYLYQDETFSMALYQSPQQTKILQSNKGLKELYKQFKKHFKLNIEQIYFYSKGEEQFPKWQRVNTELPFIALGNALWQTEIHR